MQHDRAGRLKVAYFNSDRMQVAMQKGTHSNYRFLTDFVIRNAEEASLYVNSDDSDCSQLARRRRRPGSWATPRSTPACAWTCSPPTTKYYTGKFNGRWLIRAVQHKMDRQSFQSNLMLARPDGKTQVYTGAYAPFWQSRRGPADALAEPR